LLIRAALCVDATKGPKKGKIIKASDGLRKRCSSLLSSATAAVNDCATTIQPSGYINLLHSMSDICRVIVVVSAGMQADDIKAVDDALESREEHATSGLQRACVLLKEGREQLAVATIPQVSKLLPDCIVPLFALFQMCAKVMDTFGWGRRKAKTRASAAALADLSVALALVITDMKAGLSR
jgi:hypothetical protein